MDTGIFQDISEFEKRLELPSGFYDQLLREDDWSFVVKLSALFEAACTHILVKRLHASPLEESLAHLDQGNSKYGKIVLLKKLGAITADQANVLQALAALRNRLIHRIANVGFSFTTHLGTPDAKQTTDFIKSFGHGISDPISLENKTISRREFVLNNPKLAMWLTSAEILACLYLEIEVAQLQLQKLALTEYANLSHS